MNAFDGFVILADMRTGSNALEEKINGFAGLKSHGELFNPHFIGAPNVKERFGITLKGRDTAPLRLIDAMRRQTDGLSGFRLFSDHDPRVLDHVLSDPRTAKVILTRNAVDSYVSLKIARTTGQWWLGDLKRAKPGKARFDAAEFERYAAERAAFARDIRRRLQTSGQTAFHVRYEELGDEGVIAGLAAFLGGGTRLEEGPTKKGRVQNPVPLSEKVSNAAEMDAALSAMGRQDIDAVPDFEPARGPNIPSYIASRTAPLIYLPVRCAADEIVTRWLATLEGVEPDKLETSMSQKSLRAWKRKAGAHLTFTVVEHPVARAYRAFCRYILPTAPEAFGGIRAVLSRSYDVPLPDDPQAQDFTPEARAAAFLAFLRFLKGNLAGQTAIRVDAAWASQSTVVQGFAGFALPDKILRAESLADELPALARRVGASSSPVSDAETGGDVPLGAIYSDAIERAARAAYQRDYMMFGYGPWSTD